MTTQELNAKTVLELRKIAKENGVKLGAGVSKSDIVAKIAAATADSAAAPQTPAAPEPARQESIAAPAAMPVAAPAAAPAAPDFAENLHHHAKSGSYAATDWKAQGFPPSEVEQSDAEDGFEVHHLHGWKNPLHAK